VPGPAVVRLPGVNNGLAVAIMVASLVVGGWCLVAVSRDRYVGRAELAALAVLELAVLVQTVIAVVALARGDRPVELVTFIGYLVFTALFLPGAVGLSLLERTRWGSTVAAGGAFVTAVLVLRLTQVWLPLR
jgi:hypothetical protein